MPLYTADALVLRTYKLGEADRIVVFLTRTVLFFLLRDAGDNTSLIAFLLADIVISPVLFLGGALLYFDQAARVSLTRGKPGFPREPPSS